MMRYRTLRGALRIFQHSAYGSSAAINPVAAASTDSNVNKETPTKADDKARSSHTKLVEAAFTSLKDLEENEIDEKIVSATQPEDLLLASEYKGLTRRNALKIVSKLADWTTEGKIELTSFEGDIRFIKLCQMLGHTVNLGKKKPGNPSVANISSHGFNDLGVVLGVAGDDEAAKLINTLTLPQMVKVLSSLAYKHRRSIPLLRSLAFNFGKNDAQLNIKQGADILYACAQLNFYDEVLFEKVCSDLCECIKENKKSAVIGSILTSLGMLRYKDREILDALSEWVLKNISLCRIQDIVSLVLTLGAVNYIPANGGPLFTKLESHLVSTNLSTPSLWVDVVWSLVVLNKATPKHITSVLDPEFIERLASSRSDGISISAKLKLLNINGAAKLLIDGYNGPLLDPSSEIHQVEVPRNKEKQALVAVVLDTLTNLLPSAVYMGTNISTDMGLIIDGECIMDSNLTPLPLIDKKTGKQIDRTQPGVRTGSRIAVVVLDYHDVTKREVDEIGLSNLCIRLIARLGYKVLRIPHYEFNPHDKLVTRVQYLEQQLKNVVKSC